MPKIGLQEQVVTVPLGGKLDESVDPKLLPSGSLATATNVLYDKHGLATKATGYSTVSYSFDRTNRQCNFHSVFSHNGEMLGGGLYQHSSTGYSLTDEYYQLCALADTNDKFYRKGYWVPITQSKTARVYTEDSITAPSVAIFEGYEYYAWAYDGRIFATVIDKETGTKVIENYEVQGTATFDWTNPQWVIVGDNLHIYYVGSGPGNDIVQRVISQADPLAFGSASTAENPSVTQRYYDVCVVDDTTYGYCAAVVFPNASDDIEVTYFDEDGTQRRNLDTGITVDDVLCCKQVENYADGGKYLAVAYGYDDSGTKRTKYFMLQIGLGGYRVAATDLMSHSSYDLEQITLCEDPADAYSEGVAASSIRVWVQEHTSSAYRSVRSCRAKFLTTSPGIYESEDKKLYHYYLISKAFLQDGRSHAFCKYDTGWAGADETQPRAVLFCYGKYGLTATSCTPITEALWGIDTAKDRTNNTLPPVVATGTSNQWLWPLLEDTYSIDYDATRTVVSRTLSASTITYRSESHYPAASLDADLIIGGGKLHCYDRRMQDHGFAHAPEIYLTTAATSGGDLDDGEYQWIAVYEWTDANGQWHRSAPSLAVSHTYSTGAATNKMTLDIKPLLAGDWGRNIESDQVKICIYRTQAAGSVFNHVATVDNEHAYRVQYEDTASDESIQDNRYLYTTGGVVENGTPPPATIVHRHNDRIFLVNAENPREIYYSKPKEAGIAAEFSPVLSYVFPEDIVALESLGANLVAFSENKTYLLKGDGADVFGGGGFYPLETILQDSGCSQRESVTSTDVGITFQNEKGIHVLGQPYQTISDPVKDLLGTNDVYRVITAQDEKRLRFLISNGKQLVFDYEHDRWSELSYFAAITETVRHNGSIYYYSNTAGSLYLESSGYTYGAGTEIGYTLETAWIRVGSLTGYQRVWWINLLGEWKSAHTLQVDIYTDFDDSTVVQSIDVVNASDVDLLARIKPQYQKCGTIKVKISDKDRSTPYSSADLTALELVCGFKGPKARVFSNDK